MSQSQLRVVVLGAARGLFCPAAATIAAGAAALPDAAATDGAWDVSLEKATSNSNVRLRFDQSISIHSEYIYFLYELLRFTL